MRQDRDNPLALSSKTPRQVQTDYRRELERLRADLEAEKNQAQRAHGQLGVELRRLREEAEKEQQRAVRELKARRRCQKDRKFNSYAHLLTKEVSVKDGGQHSTDEFTGRNAFCVSSGQTYSKLEQLLLTLYEKINGEQAAYKLQHRQEFELEKAILLCHLLETHGRLLQGTQRTGPPRHIFKSQTREPAQDDSRISCQTRPPLTYSNAPLQRSQRASHSPKRKPKQDRCKQPSGGDLCAADPCASVAVVDTCQGSSLKICHPQNTPHAGWDDQPSYSAESSGSDESSPSKSMERNMEVSCYIFPNEPFCLLIWKL